MIDWGHDDATSAKIPVQVIQFDKEIMNPDTVYSTLLKQLTGIRRYLDDKPEETPEGALRALWFLASGERRAVQRCLEGDLPALSEASVACLQGLLYEHTQGVPLAHLTGRQCFMGIEMLAGPEALIPRKETELLGYAALDVLRTLVAEKGHARVIDLCTGGGNLALALAYHEPACRVFAADLAPDAVDLARRNAEYLAPAYGAPAYGALEERALQERALVDQALHSQALHERVTFAVGDLFAPFDDESFVGRTDMVVCNPPYISSKRVIEMPLEVSHHEPHLAFDGGPFGVSILVRLIAEAPRYLRPGGWLCFEVGLGQGELIRRRLERSDTYRAIETRCDEEGNSRVLLARRA